ncbi:hypothetical protein BASA60_000835 [Batrachochytrium salamandrivorans]|nr:hypothetical protein BASA60_000835 [Batrachochytrium salamandrivorans]
MRVAAGAAVRPSPSCSRPSPLPGSLIIDNERSNIQQCPLAAHLIRLTTRRSQCRRVNINTLPNPHSPVDYSRCTDIDSSSMLGLGREYGLHVCTDLNLPDTWGPTHGLNQHLVPLDTTFCFAPHPFSLGYKMFP